MSLARLWAVLAVALPVLASLLASLQTVDLAYHLRAGGEILDTGRISTVDTYTFTAAGQPWHNQQWLASVVLTSVFEATGWSGLVVFRALLVGVLFGLVFDACRRGSSTRTSALLTLAAFALAAPTLALRPQLFGMVLFAGLLWLIARRVDRPGWLWLAVPLAALWANLHGSFFLGPLVVALAALEDALEPGRRARAARTLAQAGAAAAATVLNPVGVAVWGYALGIATNPVVTSRISEWQPTTPFSPEGAAFYLSVALVAVWLTRRAQATGRTDWAALAWLVPFVAIGVRAVRGLAWWPIVAAVTIGRLAGRPGVAPPSERRDPPLIRRMNAILVGALAVAGVALLPVWRPVEVGTGAPIGVLANAPPGVTAALREIVRPGDRIFAPQAWGSWLEFAIPDAQVFVDSRIELFTVDVWARYDSIQAGGNRAFVQVQQAEVTIVVAARSQRPLVGELAGAGWHFAHDDIDGHVLVRSDRLP